MFTVSSFRFRARSKINYLQHAGYRTGGPDSNPSTALGTLSLQHTHKTVSDLSSVAGVTFKFGDISLCFVNCSMARFDEDAPADEMEPEAQRVEFINNVITNLRLGDRNMEFLYQFDHLFWLGDLSFELSHAPSTAMKQSSWKQISEADEENSDKQGICNKHNIDHDELSLSLSSCYSSSLSSLHLSHHLINYRKPLKEGHCPSTFGEYDRFGTYRHTKKVSYRISSIAQVFFS